ncbi:NTP transferase domain-containing protein [Gryllotalpicola reticulitermitis]|uniref:NTP transferase domain-containing protein n=1 Tax=Gryllotalpicola reticulitermitis TaxID=1184153 RepID=A0ABV8Q1C3_9MICO
MAVATPSAGIVLAAAAGTRFGVPKALARAADGTPWVQLAAEKLLTGGCSQVTVVLGASAIEARELVPTDPRISTVTEPHWTDGLGTSLRAGMRQLEASAPPSVCAAVITLVDFPGLPVAVVRRLLNAVASTTLRQAAFSGRSTMPVVVGRQHWPEFTGTLHGESAGQSYLGGHEVQQVEVGDLWSGHDVHAY